jgi:hypothetical protein
MKLVLTDLPLDLLARILQDRWTSVWEMNTVSNTTKKLHAAMQIEIAKVKIQHSLAAAATTEILSHARMHFATPRQLMIYPAPLGPFNAPNTIFYMHSTDTGGHRGRVRVDVSREFNHGFDTQLAFSGEIHISHDRMDRVVMAVPTTDSKGFMFAYVNDEGPGAPFGGDRLMYSTVGYHRGIGAAIEALKVWKVERVE